MFNKILTGFPLQIIPVPPPELLVAVNVGFGFTRTVANWLTGASGHIGVVAGVVTLNS